MTIPVFTMDFGRLDDLDRRILARDLTAAVESWPVLAGLAAAARVCADRDVPLVYECGPGQHAAVSEALTAAYEAARANGAAVRVALLRLLTSWQRFAARY